MCASQIAVPTPRFTGTHRDAWIAKTLFYFAPILWVLLTGCGPRTVEVYSSSARADAGYTLTLDSSGHCEIRANRGGPEFASRGQYHLELDRCIMETRPRPQSVLQALLAWRTPLDRSTNWIVRTNGSEYLISAHRYDRFKETGNTNLLTDQLKRQNAEGL